MQKNPVLSSCLIFGFADLLSPSYTADVPVVPTDPPKSVARLSMLWSSGGTVRTVRKETFFYIKQL